MIYECDIDEPFQDYRERLSISDGTVKCCETSVVIPAGFPYADCQGTQCECPKDDGDWEPFPQCIEAWRWARSLRHRNIACFCFAGIEDEIEFAADESDELRLVKLSWDTLVKRVRTRYAEGKQPRLHPHEKAALEARAFVSSIPKRPHAPAAPTTANTDQLSIQTEGEE